MRTPVPDRTSEAEPDEPGGGAGPATRRDYHRQQKELIRTGGLLGGVLVAVLFPAWWFVDLALEPAQASRFLSVRLGAMVPILAILATLRAHPLGRRQPELVTFVLLLVPMAVVAWMIPQLGPGFEVYLMGYGLIAYGAGFLLAWRLTWLCAVVGAMCALLATAYLLHPGPADLRAIAVSGIYIGSSTVIAAVAALHRERVAFREFTARHEALRQRDRAEGLRRQLEELSRQDPLTAAANRREWDARLGEEWSRAFRTGAPLSILLIDIDRFKEINDSFGHDAGDATLRALTDLIRRRVRRSDLLARIGGDEFALLCPDTPLDEACRLASELLERVRGLRLPHLRDREITISVGVAERSTSHGGPRETVQAADRQLYLAKETRNAVWGRGRQWEGRSA